MAKLIAGAQMPVEISGTSEDAVGRRVVFAVKEEIRNSSSLALEFDQNKAKIQVKNAPLCLIFWRRS
jgi:hypothetical protein